MQQKSQNWAPNMWIFRYPISDKNIRLFEYPTFGTFHPILRIQNSLNETIIRIENPFKNHFLSFLYFKKGAGYKFRDYLK